MQELPSSSRSRRVLVVDADDAIRRLLAAVFHRLEIAVDTVVDGEAAVTHVRQARYDTLIVGLPWPDASLLGELDAVDDTLLSRTVVLTVPSMRAKLAGTNGIYAILTKPFELDALVSAVLSCD